MSLAGHLALVRRRVGSSRTRGSLCWFARTRSTRQGRADFEKNSRRKTLDLRISKIRDNHFFFNVHPEREPEESKEEGVQRGMARGTVPATAGSDCPGARSVMADTSMIPSPPRPAAHAAVSRLSATSSPSGHTRAEHQWRRTVSPRT